MPDNKILVSRPSYQGLGLGLETWWPRSWSWSRDLVAKVLVLVSRPGGQGLGLGLELFSKVLITSLLIPTTLSSLLIRRRRCYYRQSAPMICTKLFFLDDEASIYNSEVSHGYIIIIGANRIQNNASVKKEDVRLIIREFDAFMCKRGPNRTHRTV